MPPTRYVLDPSWHAERERLGSLTRLYDGTTVVFAPLMVSTWGRRPLA